MKTLAAVIDTVLGPRVGIVVLVVLALVLLLFPLIGEEARYLAVLLMTVFLFATLGHAWNLLAGFCGLLSFGTQVYVGLSGFTVAIAAYYFGVPVWVGAILGAIVAALFAWLQAMPISDRNTRRNTAIGVIAAVVLWALYEIAIAVNPAADVFGSDYIRRVVILFGIFLGALPLLKLQGAYFAVATWLIAAAVASIFNEWRVVGAGGGMTVPSETTITERYYAGLLIVAASTLVVWWLLRSRYGAALTAVRDDEEAASAIGIDIRRIKTMVFVISAPMAGLAAALYYVDSVTITPPDAFSIRWSAYVVFIVVAGGMGTLWGPVVGAVLFVIVQRFLVGFWGGGELTLGIAAVLLILVLPRGAVGLVDDVRRWAQRTRHGAPETVPRAPAPAEVAARKLAASVGIGSHEPAASSGIVAAGLVPASPLPALRPQNPPWQPLAASARILGERFAARGVTTVVLYSTTWRVPGVQPVHLRRHLEGRFSDPQRPGLGAFPFKVRIDQPFAGRIVEAARAQGIPAQGHEALGLPVDAGTAAASHLIDPEGRFEFVVCGASSLLDAAEAARFGRLVAQEAQALGRPVAILAAGGLSASRDPRPLAPESDAIATEQEDALNRRILGALLANDHNALAALPREEADARLSHLAFVMGALSGRASEADVLAYGATSGAGAAVVDLSPR